MGRGAESSQRMKTLIVLVPAPPGRRGQAGLLLERLLEEPALEGAHAALLVPRHRHAGRGARALARQLEARIEGAWRTGGGFDDLILIATGNATPLLRQAFLYARSPESHCAWVGRVSRIVLIGAPRGERAGVARWSALTELVPELGPLKRDLGSGSSFLCDLDLSWTETFSRLEPRVPRIEAIELSCRRGRDFFGWSTAEEAEARYGLLVRALTHTAGGPAPQAVTDGSASAPLLFCLPGAPLAGEDWVAAVEARAQHRQPHLRLVRPPFATHTLDVLPYRRQLYLRWFRERYRELRTRHPEATFHCLAHGAGSVVLGEALRDTPHMRFERVLLAGALLPRNYDWSARIEGGQVALLRNERGENDWRAGVLAAGLRGLGFDQVGSAGFDGFLGSDARLSEQVAAHGHWGALESERRDASLEFLLAGRVSDAAPQLFQRGLGQRRMRWLARAAPYAAWVLLWLLIAGLWTVASGPGLAALALTVLLGAWALSRL